MQAAMVQVHYRSLINRRRGSPQTDVGLAPRPDPAASVPSRAQATGRPVRGRGARNRAEPADLAAGVGSWLRSTGRDRPTQAGRCRRGIISKPPLTRQPAPAIPRRRRVVSQRTSAARPTPSGQWPPAPACHPRSSLHARRGGRHGRHVPGQATRTSMARHSLTCVNVAPRWFDRLIASPAGDPSRPMRSVTLPKEKRCSRES